MERTENTHSEMNWTTELNIVFALPKPSGRENETAHATSSRERNRAKETLDLERSFTSIDV